MSATKATITRKAMPAECRHRKSLMRERLAIQAHTNKLEKPSANALNHHRGDGGAGEFLLTMSLACNHRDQLSHPDKIREAIVLRIRHAPGSIQLKWSQ